MTEDNDSLFPAIGPLPEPTRYALPAWLTPAAGESRPAPSRRQKPAAELTAAEVISLMQRRAMDLLEAGRFAEALAVFEKFLAIEPEDVNWLFLKGVCLLELGKYQAALAPLAAAERLAPWDPDVLLIKADVLLELREYAQARQALSKLFAFDPEHSRGRYRLACWAALTGRPRQALNELRRLVAADSGFREEAAREPAFAGLRGLPAFRKLLAAPPRQE